MKVLKRTMSLFLVTALVMSLAGCSGNKAKDSTLVIYDGQFSEMRILHYMAKLLIEEHTDLTVDIKDEMAPVNSYNELLKGSSDLMNSYDGTLVTTFLHLDPSDCPKDMTLFDFANQAAAKEGVQLVGKQGINNTYAVAVPQSIADTYSLESISDLIPIADQLVFGAEHDFFTEEGSAKYHPFVKFYGLEFKEAKQLDISLKYAAIESGNIDVTVAYATDGLNRKADLKILKDDLHFFPEYNGSLLVRTDIYEKFADTAPNLEEVLKQMDGIFTDEDMVSLSYAVDVEGALVADVAKEYLQQKGLL